MRNASATRLCSRLVSPAVLALIAPLVLAACNSSGRSVENTLNPRQASNGDKLDYEDIRGYCPKLVMRAGTQTYDVYPDKMKKDDPDIAQKLRFRSTITEAVRECNYDGDTLNMRIGIAGRTITGPSGEAGQQTLPIRIAATRGDEVLYSQLHEVAVQIPPGGAGATFSFIDNGISLPRPERENIIVYVGFDALRVDLPNAVPPRQALQPVN